MRRVGQKRKRLARLAHVRSRDKRYIYGKQVRRKGRNSTRTSGSSFSGRRAKWVKKADEIMVGLRSCRTAAGNQSM